MSTQLSNLEIKVALLDIDGTLLDSNHAHTLSWMEILEKHGYHATYEKVRSLIGKGSDKLLPELTGSLVDSEQFTLLTEARTSLFMTRFLPRLRPTNGARRMLQKMRSECLRIVVATSAGKELSKMLRQANVEDLVELSATLDDANNSKPDGDIVVAALKKAGVSPRQALMFGDTPYDIVAARAAGVACVALRCGGWWEDSALNEAIALFDDPAAVARAWPKHLLRFTSH